MVTDRRQTFRQHLLLVRHTIAANADSLRPTLALNMPMELLALAS
jgi:hypothetical protein